MPTYSGKTHTIFTKPHSVKKAYKKPKRRRAAKRS